MTTKELAERLASQCARPRLETPAGRILVPEEPVDLLEELTGLVDDAPEHVADELLWNGFADAATRWWGRDVWRPAIEFVWQGLGPLEWDASIDVLTL